MMQSCLRGHKVNPTPGTRNPEPATRNPKHGTRNTKPGPRNSKPETRNENTEHEYRKPCDATRRTRPVLKSPRTVREPCAHKRRNANMQSVSIQLAGSVDFGNRSKIHSHQGNTPEVSESTPDIRGGEAPVAAHWYGPHNTTRFLGKLSGMFPGYPVKKSSCGCYHTVEYDPSIKSSLASRN